MSAIGILLPILLIVFGWWLKYTTPKNRLGAFGYRTERSRRTQQAWNFSNKMAGKYWLLEGIIMLPVSVLALWLLHTRFQGEGYTIVCCVLLLVQILCMMIPMPFVERSLKNKFGE